MTEVRAFAVATGAGWRTELRRALRDRRALTLVFVMPVVIASLVVFALGSDDDPPTFDLGWVVTSDDPSVQRFVDEVIDGSELSGLVRWERIETVALARGRVADERLGAAIVISPAVRPGDPAELVLVADEDPVAAGVAATVIDEYRVAHAAAVAAHDGGVPPPERGRAVTMEIVAPRGASLDAAVHWGPAMGGFFVLLAIGHAAHRRVEDRHRDIDARLRATPTGVAPVTVGRSLAATTMGGASLLLMAGATRVLFGRTWGPWPQVALVALATALAVAGIGAVVASISRTAGSAQSLTSLVAFAMAIGGGSFSPPGSSDVDLGWERWLPTSLSLEGFGSATTTGRWGELAVPVLALLGTAVALLAAGSLHARRPAS